MKLFILALVLILFLILVGATLATPQGTSSPGYDDVKLTFEDNCIMCHNGPKAPKGLRLDSYESLLKGSERGLVVKSGDPAGSELVKRIRGISTPRMPLSGPPWLDEKEIQMIEEWIRNGAQNSHTASAGEQLPGESPTRQTSEKRTPDRNKSVTFKDVAPIFKINCVKCHNHKGLMGQPPEGLVLASYREIMAGTERVYVVPGNPDASELVRKIRGQSLPRMPFDGPPYLTANEIALIEKWVAQGAMDEAGQRTAIPVGRRVRLHGRLTSAWSLDALKLEVGGRTEIKKRTLVGDYVEVRGMVTSRGGVDAERIRARKSSSQRGDDD